jgi:hypothetical protein
MPELGPFIIQNTNPTWLIIETTSDSTPTVQRLLLAPFDPNAKGAPDISSYTYQNPKQLVYRAYDVENERYFSIVITKNLEVLRYRPTDHRAFLEFQFNDTNTKLPMLFLEQYKITHWSTIPPRKILTDHVKINYLSLRDQLGPRLKAIINLQYQALPTNQNSWDEDRKKDILVANQRVAELEDNGFYVILLNLRSNTKTRAEYVVSLRFVLNTRNKTSVNFSTLSKETKDNTSQLLRYFYDVQLHKRPQPKIKGQPYIPPLLDLERFTVMQEALYLEEPTLREETNQVTYAESIELRKLFVPPPEKTSDAYAVAKHLLLCLASTQYLDNLYLQQDANYSEQEMKDINIILNYGYLVFSYNNNTAALKKLYNNVLGMLSNHEEFWEVRTRFEELLNQENPDYDPTHELMRLKLTITARIDRIIKNSVKLYTDIPSAENLNLILRHITTTSNLVVALSYLKTAEQQKKLLGASNLTHQDQLLIQNIDDLKIIIKALHVPTKTSLLIIFHAIEPKKWGAMVKSSEDLNFLCETFDTDCQNRLINHNTQYFSKFFKTIQNILSCINSIANIKLWEILSLLSFDAKNNLIQTSTELCDLLCFSKTDEFNLKLKYIFKIIPNPHRVDYLIIATNQEKLSFFTKVAEEQLKIYFGELSDAEWNSLFETPNHLKFFTKQLGFSDRQNNLNIARKLIRCIPVHIKDKFYVELFLEEQVKLLANPPNQIKDFEALKKAIEQLFNPSLLPVISTLWKPPTDYTSATNMRELKHAILDAFCFGKDSMICSKANSFLEAYINNQSKQNTKKISNQEDRRSMNWDSKFNANGCCIYNIFKFRY